MSGLDNTKTTMAALSLLLLLALVAPSSALPLPSEDTDKWLLAEKYLRRFYGLPIGIQDRQRSAGAFRTKLMEMQKFFKLKVTEDLDDNTMNLMSQARCGVPDVSAYSQLPGGPKWRKNDITFRILNYTPDLKRSDTDRAIRSAFNVWSKVTPLKFKKLYYGNADIMISFAAGEHGDNSPFDGPNKLLAHAYLPGEGIGGDTHFDEDENWTKDSSAYNLFIVAAHEFGHALGLSHSDNAGALMYPAYIYRTGYPLAEDDIKNIQERYGPNPNSQKVKPKPDAPNKCDPMLSFDAVTELRGETIIFKDRFYWRLHPQMPEPQQSLIHSTWPSLPNKVDAAYENAEDQVIIFSGIRMWALNGYDLVDGYPKYIHKLGLPNSVRKIDAAVHIRDTGKTLLFVEEDYWSYDEAAGTMDAGYPRSIKNDFPGMGDEVDAAAYHYGYLYFFHKHIQYEYSYNARKVIRIMEANSIFNC